MRIAKHPDWQSRLSRFLAAREGIPFEWGFHDCTVAACDVLVEISNLPDPAGPWRDRYRTANGAYRSLKAYLRRQAEAFAHWTTEVDVEAIPREELLRWAAIARADELGLKPVDPLRMQRGDPVVVRAPIAGGAEADCLGFVSLTSEVLVAGELGFVAVDPGRVLSAWRVP